MSIIDDLELDKLRAKAARTDKLEIALRALYERYCTDEDGWSVEPECHHLAREALGLSKS